MRDDLSGLRALLRVAQKRSFRAAAAELRVTPSAMSQSVRALEERLGVRLVQRTTRSVGLTEVGAQFVARLKPALDGIDDAIESLGALRGRPAGLLRLTMLRTGYADVLKPKLARFLAAYPDIRIDISLDEALADVVAEGFDAGLRLGKSLDREMIGVRVSADQQVVVVGAPSYFARRGKPSHPSELHAHDCINLRNTKGSVVRWGFRERGSDFEIAVDGQVVTNDGAVLVDAAVEGLGLAYVFDSMVGQLVSQRRLVRVLEEYCPQIPGYFLYYPSRVNLAPKLKALVDFLRSDQSQPGPTGSSSRRARSGAT
ncbi:LysR family transcriptional regulator [Anaeromyxobacter oryzae]|uniref:LysR family transcriptional regulator n=1 Tax=Anaeromyxobacter oryzae TaxID=2918170 RepID=A0ABM7WQ09_9BACT|nr:LysR family transcriptional regulator [Anaeromyxobacter oryzae]BDG01546.1 LysR family transcriptional regulator [Anaeromyxobacter oryzae]